MKSLFTLVLTVFLFAIEASAQLFPTTGGPDKYGYVWRDSKDTDPKKPVPRWVELVNVTNKEGVKRLTGNGLSYIGPLPFGFKFDYYWYDRAECIVDRNGYIIFEPSQLQSTFDIIPYAKDAEDNQGDDFIAPFMAGLNTSTGTNPTSGVYFWTDNKDSVVVTWEKMSFGEGGNATFQLILIRQSKTILFQYAEVTGSVSNSCLAIEQNNEAASGRPQSCFLVGMEDKIGKSGIMISDDNVTRYLSYSKAAPYAINLIPEAVGTQNYQLLDLSVNYVGEVGTPGRFVLKNQANEKAIVNFKNNGTVDVDESVLIQGVLKKNNGAVQNDVLSQSALLKPLKVNQDTTIVFASDLPFAEAGVYGLEGVAAFGDDAFKYNNRLQQFIGVADTTGGVVKLDYVPGGGGADFTWAGASNFTSGVGIYIRPPYYPAVVSSVSFVATNQGLAPTETIRINIYDDNGKNVFGLPDGSRGDLLYTKDVLATAQNATYSTTTVDDYIQINSGGVYISEMQGGPNAFYHTSSRKPYALTMYKVFGSQNFFPYQDRQSKNIAMGMAIKVGDPALAPDAWLKDITSPAASEEVFDSTAITIAIENTSDVVIKAPFGASYFVNNRAPVVEQVLDSILPGATLNYTFNQKTARPPAPKTKFDKICAYIFVDNDINEDNDVFCSVGVFDGVEPKNDNIKTMVVFPNPASEDINVVFGFNETEEYQLEIYNIQGQLIVRRNGTVQGGTNRNERFEVSNLPQGNYLYKLTTNSTYRAGRIYVVHE